MKVAELIAPNQSDKKAKEMGLPNFYTDKGQGKKTGVRREKVVVRDSKTGKVYGRRTVWQKNT